MRKPITKFFKKMGPGFITGASDDDPSGIATYTQTGAQFGLGQLWTMVLATPFVAAIQQMCGRIGLVTGMGLAGVIRQHYSRTLLVFVVTLLVAANAVNIGADLGAMAASLQLLVPLPFPVLILGITALTLFLEVFVSYKVYVKYLKYFALSLLAYFGVAFFITIDWLEAGKRLFVPEIIWSKTYLLNIVALLGTTISPYLFFWQTSEEVEELVAENKLADFGKGKPNITARDLAAMRADTTRGMIFSNVVAIFIMMAAAATLLPSGITQVDSAAQAAAALEPIAGPWAQLLFAIGIIGTGLLAVPVLAGSASYAVSEAAQWKEGLFKKFSQAHGFYGVITIATLLGLAINFTDIPPFRVLYYTAVLNGVASPILMVLILFVSNNKKIMGRRVNSRLANVLGWTITVVMGACALALGYTMIF